MKFDLFRFCDLITQKYYYRVICGTFCGVQGNRHRQARIRASRNLNLRLHSTQMFIEDVKGTRL